MNLQLLRAQLDEVDLELIHVLARRAALVDAIWGWKQEHGVGRVDAEREVVVKERLLTVAVRLGLSVEAVEPILKQIVGRSLK